jgi:hypothetical protein
MENEIMSVDMVVRLLLPNKSDIPYRGLLKRLMCKTPELTAYKETTVEMLHCRYDNLRLRDLKKLSPLQIIILQCFLDKFFKKEDIEKFMNVIDIMEKLNMSEVLFDKYPEEKFNEICDKILESK